MPHIFDNINQDLLPALTKTISVSERADFCVGYLNLRGWKTIDRHVEKWSGGEGHCCRLLIGMHRLPEEEMRIAQSLLASKEQIDKQTAVRLKKKLVEEFRRQLELGAPNNEDEEGLRRLAWQIKNRKLVVKLFLEHPLHAKLYLLFRPRDPVAPCVGYLGSSNLTLAGLSRQGELNIDVTEQDTCDKLSKWFEERWNNHWCMDISEELTRIIEESWAREELIPPYHIYVKMAYHLSREARSGLTEFRIPKDFGNILFEFQEAAVKIAARHLNKRGGVLIGDVVGLGKTLMATALARVFEDDYGFETLILCPKNLEPMWKEYSERYRMRGTRILSTGRVITELPRTRRFRLVIIDESHNLRNRQSKRYLAIRDYVKKNDSKCILLSATPYNKTYQDLSNQLRLFVEDDKDLGVRPEKLLRKIGERERMRLRQLPSMSCLKAFDMSEHAGDWRDLMRLYLVRRTRSFIQKHYAKKDPANGRNYLTFADKERYYFPTRVPKTLPFDVDRQYARLFSDEVVEIIRALELPRYGLAQEKYLVSAPNPRPNPKEQEILDDLSRGGKRLVGFCRTGLFKRLESSGYAFLLSVKRHILRNLLYLHAIENGKPLPIGRGDVGLWDPQSSDEDVEEHIDDNHDEERNDEERNDEDATPGDTLSLRSWKDFRAKAAQVYNLYAGSYQNRFRWLSPHFFTDDLRKDLESDAEKLRRSLPQFEDWDANQDAKLAKLRGLLEKQHPDKKVLVFTQFADTVRYIEKNLKLGAYPKCGG